MKAKELREMTDVELNKQLKDLKAELFNLRFQHAINQLDNPRSHRCCEEGHRPRDDHHGREER